MTKKKKNEGFTLVELVIAVVILAIAVSPLVSNFIQSSRMNLKSRKALNAMNLAQDIMEGMSQYSVSTNTTYFDTATTNPGSLADVRILPSGTTISGCTAISTDPQKYIYQIRGIKTTSGNYNNYDVNVTFNAGDPGSDLEKVSSQDIADIKAIDRTKDVVYTISSSMTDNDLLAVKNFLGHPADDIANYAGHLTRTITLNITKKLDGGQYKYECKAIRKYESGGTGGLTIGSSSQQSDVTLPSSKDMPRAIYLYYTGFPGAGAAGSRTDANARDNIEIINKTGEQVTVYLIRTVTSTTSGGNIIVSDPVAGYSTNYRCDVTIEGKKARPVQTTPTYIEGYTLAENLRVYENDENVDLVSNIRLDLSQTDKNYRVYKENSSELLPGLTAADASDSHYDARRSKIKYNGATVTEDMYNAHISDGYLKSNKKLLYKVTVEISEAGSSNVMATYTGGLSN